MNINATLINLFKVCPRECWLHANGINMEHTSDIVADGKIVEENSYQQRNERYTQIELSEHHNGINLTGKIDYYDPRNKVVHETKRSNKVEDAHISQVKFYLWLLHLNDVEKIENLDKNENGIKGVINYPTLRKTELVFLDEKDIAYLEKAIVEIKELVARKSCPPTINANICRSCSYYDFCYAGEI